MRPIIYCGYRPRAAHLDVLSRLDAELGKGVSEGNAGCAEELQRRYGNLSLDFDEVYLADPVHERSNRWVYRDPSENRSPVALAVRGWILRHYPQAFRDHETAPTFAGFKVETFLDLLRLLCLAPEVAAPLPFPLHRSTLSVESLLNLADEALVPGALRRLGVRIEEDWTLSKKPHEDARIALELIARFRG